MKRSSKILITSCLALLLVVMISLSLFSTNKKVNAELSIQTTKSYSPKSTFNGVSPQYLATMFNLTLPTTNQTSNGGNFTFMDYYNHIACVNIDAKEQAPQNYYYIYCTYTMSYTTSGGYVFNLYIYFYRDYTLNTNYAYINYIVNFNMWGSYARISTPTSGNLARQTLLLMNLMSTNETHMTFISHQQGNTNVYSTPNLDTDSDTYKILMLCFNQYDSQFSSSQQAYTNGYNEGKDEGYQKGHDEGYEEGKDYGEEIGFENGKNYGFDLGYEDGKRDGLQEGNQAFNDYNNILAVAWNSATTFLSTPVFGGLTILHLILLPLTLGVFIIIIKIVRG